MKLLAMILVILLLGCATPRLETWIGATRDGLLLTYGVPKNVVRLEDGSSLVEYYHSRMSNGTEYYCTARFLFSPDGLVKDAKAEGNIGGCNRLVKANKEK